MMKSILLPEMKGVMFITGRRGKGKSYLASQADFPNNICFFDFEDKGEGIHNQLQFGHYKSFSQAENNPLSRGKFLLSEIEQLENNKYTVAIIDNIRPLEDSLMALVMDKPSDYAKLYGKETNSVIKDSYGARRGIANDLIGDAILKPLYTKGVNLVVATSHVKPVYQIPNKEKSQGKDRWQELSILTLILMDGDNFPIPSATVWKEQLGKITAIASETADGQMKSILSGEVPAHNMIRRLPMRMPEATFQKIRWYLHNPANLTNPAKGETLVKSEIEPFTEQLSSDQLRLQILSLEAQQKADNEMASLFNNEQVQAKQEIIDEIKTMKGPPMMILKRAQEMIANGNKYNGELSERLLLQWRKN